MEACATPAEAARGAGVVVTMLSDADAVTGAMDGAEGGLAGVEGDAVWLQTSTIGEEGATRCAELAAARGVVFVDAPVLGTKGPAEQGALVVLASGPEDARPRVEPVLDAVGARTMWVGEAGRGSLLKLVTNAWIMAVVEGAAETVALAEGLGLDPALLLEAVAGGPLDLPYLQVKAAAMAERDFTPSFRWRSPPRTPGWWRTPRGRTASTSRCWAPSARASSRACPGTATRTSRRPS